MCPDCYYRLQKLTEGPALTLKNPGKNIYVTDIKVILGMGPFSDVGPSTKETYTVVVLARLPFGGTPLAYCGNFPYAGGYTPAFKVTDSEFTFLYP